MSVVFMPFLMSMLLGRTIDLTTYTIGGDIYDNDKYDETNVNHFDSTYIVLQGNSLPYTFMGLPEDIVLRLKAGFLSSSSGNMGLDGFLREATRKQTSAVIAVVSAVQTVKRSLKKDAKLLPNWKSRISDSQTHYANSILYGGWSIILYRFQSDIIGDVDIMRETLISTLGQSGELGSETIKLWKNATDSISKKPEIRGKDTLQINSYSSFPFEHNLTTPDGMLQAISNIPRLVGPIGKPIFMELLPLHELDEKYRVVEPNHELDREIQKIDGMYDDVKNTKNRINLWVSKTDATFTDEKEEEISDLINHLSACIKLFHKIASEASIYGPMDRNLLNSALHLYNSRLQNNAFTYDKIFRKLKEDTDVKCENSFLHSIKGLLKVDNSEQMEVGKVEGGLEECKMACLAVRKCRSIGYVDRKLVIKLSSTAPRVYTMVTENKLCYIYFRSSSTAEIVKPSSGSVTGVYDRKCH